MFLDGLGNSYLANKYGIPADAFIIFLLRLPMYAFPIITGSIGLFVAMYHRHTKKMEFKENPAPIYMVFLLCAGFTFAVIASWAWDF